MRVILGANSQTDSLCVYVHPTCHESLLVCVCSTSNSVGFSPAVLTKCNFHIKCTTSLHHILCRGADVSAYYQCTETCRVYAFQTSILLISFELLKLTVFLYKCNGCETAS